MSLFIILPPTMILVFDSFRSYFIHIFSRKNLLSIYSSPETYLSANTSFNLLPLSLANGGEELRISTS